MPNLFPFSLLFLFLFPWLLTSICNTNYLTTRKLFFFSFSYFNFCSKLFKMTECDPLCRVKRINNIWYRLCILNSLHINVKNNHFHFGDFATWNLKLVIMHIHFRICVDYTEDNIAKFLSYVDEFPLLVYILLLPPFFFLSLWN